MPCPDPDAPADETSSSPVTRAQGAPRLLATWLASLLLFPGTTGQGTVVDACLATAWLLLLVAGTVASRNARVLAALGSGLCLVALWAASPRSYPVPALLYLTVVAWGVSLGPTPRLDRRTVGLALGTAALPAALAALAWSVGDENAREMLRDDWRFPSASFVAVSTVARIQAIAALAWLSLSVARDEVSRAGRGVVLGAAAVLVMACCARAVTLASLVALPGDAQWSEPPLLLNLLKLQRGVPVYGPLEDCNSYSYGPALEVVHHALLSPFGLDLSLLANRVLVLGWQLVTAAVLTAIVMPLVAVPGSSKAQRAVRGLLVTAAMLLVAASSFLASNLHPDHLLMPWFALALGLALRARRLPSRVMVIGLLVLPALCTAVKLTGAGVGVGLALAFAWPLRRRTVLALAGSAALAVGTIVVLDRMFPNFWRYTFALQASHPVRWREWPSVFSEAPGRLLVVALVGIAVAFALGPRARTACGDATRMMAVTLGFAVPSLVAYLKVGGRVNSLLPLAIGSTVVLARLAAELASAYASGAPIGAALAVWAALTLSPATEPVTRDVRNAVRGRHERAVALIRAEVGEGRRTLFYDATAAWLDAGQRDVPRDRWQIVNELLIGHHAEVEAHFTRLENGTYDALVMSDAVFDTQTPAAPRLARIVAAHYRLEGGEPPTSGALYTIRVYRRVNPTSGPR